MPSLTVATIRSLLAEHGLRPRRALGQHFLADPNTARRIVRLAEVDDGDAVLEIGPGLGSLTVELVAAGARVVALEIDPRVAAVLTGVVGAGVRIEVGDALRVDLAALLGPGCWVCVSNLPYNVATPVVVRLLEEAPQVERLLVMVQREVGERLAASPGDRAYGAVSVKVAYRAEARVVASVPASVFFPKPKVESVLVRLRRLGGPAVEVPSEASFFALVEAGFAQRRKMLRRALQPVLGARTAEVLAAAGVDPASRAERVGLDGWAALTWAAAA